MTTERKLWLTPSYQAHRLALVEGLFSAFLLVEHGNGAENVVPYYTLPLDFVLMSIPEAGFRLVLINVVYHCGFSSPCVTSCTLSVVELSARAHQMISILLWLCRSSCHGNEQWNGPASRQYFEKDSKGFRKGTRMFAIQLANVFHKFLDTAQLFLNLAHIPVLC